MKIKELLTEDVSQLKKDVITQVQQTDDEQLLDRIYTVLNQSGLADRIGGVLTRDTDTEGYVDEITRIIIDTPGTYQEKYAFIEAFPTGYVNIKLMLSGNRVTFEDLLQGGKFVHSVFQALKRYQPAGVKGPGEFALAVMSPHIKITGKGDLNIGDQVVEVKASAGKTVSSGGGRLGTPGLLHSDRVATIIKKYIPTVRLETGVNLSLEGLQQLAANLEPVVKEKLAKDVFGYIFGRSVDTSELESAFAAGQSLSGPYTKANWALYQQHSGFTGVMLINFALGQLQYFANPADIISNIYSTNVYLISKDKGAQSRQILSQVTLKGLK